MKFNIFFIFLCVINLSLSFNQSSKISNIYNDVHSSRNYSSQVEFAIWNLKSNRLKFHGPKNSRQKSIVDAFVHGWNGYQKYAWGYDELMPISKNYKVNFRMGLNIIDSLDTAIIMGLEKETEQGIKWITEHFEIISGHSVNLFECTIRVLGGLLSAFHLTENPILLIKAKEVGDNLLAGFTSSPSSIPLTDVVLGLNTAESLNQGLSHLAEALSLQLEFRDLSRSTGDPKYEKMSFATSEHIHKIGCSKFEGLCPHILNCRDGTFHDSKITIGSRSDSYYEYLIKQWLQTGKTIDWLAEDFVKAMDAVNKFLFIKNKSGHLSLIGEYSTYLIPRMEHLSCFLSGALVLSYLNKLNDKHLTMAAELGDTCYKMYNNSAGLGPESVYMDKNIDYSFYIKKSESQSVLRPEAIEAWFYLYRATGDKKYQEWGWTVFKSIEKHSKIESGGYSSIESVLKKNTEKTDEMHTFFMAETLKYLYLLFEDDQSLFPLDEWVFNTEAHPLPIYKE